MSDFFEVRVDNQAKTFFGKLVVRLRRLDPLMEEVATLTEETIEQCFESESDPSGSPWAELAPSTLAQRRRQGQRGTHKLIASGKGKRSIRVIVRGTQVMITYLDYMDHHQKGTRTTPQRQFAPTAEDVEQGSFGEQIQQRTVQYLNPTAGQFIAREMQALPRIGKVFGRR